MIVTPSREHQACCLPDGTIEVSAGCVARLGQFTDSTEEALAGLLATLAHEMAHHVFRHEVRAGRAGEAGGQRAPPRAPAR